MDGNLGGIVEAVDDDSSETAEQQLKNGVAADVTGSAGHQDGSAEHEVVMMRSVLVRKSFRKFMW